jgi:hypothetical protein
LVPQRRGPDIRAQPGFHALVLVGKAMVRRKCLPSMNPFDPGQKANEDAFFYLRIVAKYKVDVVPEFLIGYRWNTGQNNSTNLNRQILSYESMIEKICRMDPNIPRRVLHWSEAGFYLS